jgi:hypothetical protein
MNRYRGSENVFENVSFNDYPPWKRLWLLLGWVVFSVTAVGRAEELAVGHFARDGLNGWQAKIFEGKTDYRLTRDNGRVVVQATSHAAASGLVKEIAFNPAEFRYLRWSWKIENTIPGGDETTREGMTMPLGSMSSSPGSFSGRPGRSIISGPTSWPGANPSPMRIPARP